MSLLPATTQVANTKADYSRALADIIPAIFPDISSPLILPTHTTFRIFNGYLVVYLLDSSINVWLIYTDDIHDDLLLTRTTTGPDAINNITSSIRRLIPPPELRAIAAGLDEELKEAGFNTYINNINPPDITIYGTTRKQFIANIELSHDKVRCYGGSIHHFIHQSDYLNPNLFAEIVTLVKAFPPSPPDWPMKSKDP